MRLRVPVNHMNQGGLSADEQNHPASKTANSEHCVLGLINNQFSPSLEPLPPVCYMSGEVEGLSQVEGRLVQVQQAHVEPRAKHVSGEGCGHF